MKNLPQNIYLQIGPDVELGTDFNTLHNEGITWAAEKIHKNDIKYKLARKPNHRKDLLAIPIGWERGMPLIICKKHPVSSKILLKPVEDYISPVNGFLKLTPDTVEYLVFYNWHEVTTFLKWWYT